MAGCGLYLMRLAGETDKLWLLAILIYLLSRPPGKMFDELSHRCPECQGRGWMHKVACSQHNSHQQGNDDG